MGKKRSVEDREEKIRSKIRKLESKLEKARRSTGYPSENEFEDDLIIHVEDQYESDGLQQLDHVFVESPPQAAALDVPPASPRPASPRPVSPRPATAPPRPASPVPGPSSAPDLPLGQPEAVSAAPEDLTLDDEILKMLGEAPKAETALGSNIHKDVASRWNEILQKGLPKEVKDKILQEYLVPSNCNLLVAPSLNPEAKAALPEPLVKRDLSIMHKQKQLGLALAALAQATDLIIKKETCAQKILKPISDACRILCDSHFYETKTRRNFVISAINTELKDTLINTVRNDFLFGDNVSEKLKTAKSIQKSGDTLKNTQRTPYNNFNKNNFTAKAKNPRSNLNLKPQHRRPPGRSDAGTARTQQPPRPTRPAVPRSPPPRPPPPPPRRTYRK